MITNRSLTHNRPTTLIIGLVAVLVLTALAAVYFSGQGFNTSVFSANPAAAGPASQRSSAAYSARLAGQAQVYAPVNAYAARWTGLADSASAEQAKRAQAVQMQYLAGNTARAVEAYAGRSAGLAETYAPANAYAARLNGLAEAFRQRAINAYAARWQGLAETYPGN